MIIPPITALVPMKKNSERVPNKNYRNLAGKPAFHWIMEQLELSQYITEILVNTDSEEISKSALKHFSKVKTLQRPYHLTGGDVSIQPLIEHDMRHTKNSFFFQTHSTNPLVTASTIDTAIEFFFSQNEHDTLFSVTQVQSRFYWENGIAINHDPQTLLKTQDLPPIYEENSCFYIFSRESNALTNNRLGRNPVMYPINRLEAVDIDNFEDFYWAEYLLTKSI